MMMLQCWESVPEKRPSFKTLYTNTSKLIEGIAGYLEIGFNPFAAAGEGEEEPATERNENREEGMQPAVTFRVIPPSVDSGKHFSE